MMKNKAKDVAARIDPKQGALYTEALQLAVEVWTDKPNHCAVRVEKITRQLTLECYPELTKEG